MACYHPLIGWKSGLKNPSTGKNSIVFSAKLAKRSWVPFLRDPGLRFPCGYCLGCKLDRSREWAIRAVHEASLYRKNCFITLTYNEANLPKDRSLVLRDFQLFMKRLRRWYDDYQDEVNESLERAGKPSLPKQRIRFYGCGEYGALKGRPHYHALLFNFDFPDKIPFNPRNRFGRWHGGDHGQQQLFISGVLDRIWSDGCVGSSRGYTSIGSVTTESAGYVARYVTKKLYGDKACVAYGAFSDLQSGKRCYLRKPEFSTMSRRPGIGRGWIEKYHGDVYPHDFVLFERLNKPVQQWKPPKFYDRFLELAFPKDYENVKLKRIEKMKASDPEEQSPWRLRVREAIQQQKFKLLKRSLEDDSESF